MTSAHQNRSDELRLLHWNIHSWRDDDGQPNLDAVVNLVQTTAPHVVSLVEVDESWGHRSKLDELAERCGYTSIFVPALEFGTDAPAGGFGNALLSTLPILAVRQRQLLWPPRFYDGTEPSEQRTVVFSKFQAAAGPLWIGSTHLPRSEADTRVDAAQRIMAMTYDLDAPWMLLGDFNMPANDWINAHPTLRAHPEPAESTHPANNPIEPIDYCVAPQGVLVRAKVLPDAGSDHLAILASCRL